tara:strand:+ start:155 stop:403 length:249 start_codon:yes stop_codon:yes gene_type:complete
MNKTGYIGDYKYDEMDTLPQVAYRLTREQVNLFTTMMVDVFPTVETRPTWKTQYTEQGNIILYFNKEHFRLVDEMINQVLSA